MGTVTIGTIIDIIDPGIGIEFEQRSLVLHGSAVCSLQLKEEMVMTKFVIGPIALVIAMFPVVAIAQTTNPNPQGTQSVEPTRPNSGAGIPGQPGNKSGPAAKKPETTGSDANRPAQDSSNIPGKPGSKSGPVQRSPSSLK